MKTGESDDEVSEDKDIFIYVLYVRARGQGVLLNSGTGSQEE